MNGGYVNGDASSSPHTTSQRRWLAARRISSVSVVWKEDVRVWHPGQHWIWKGGGLGVFDPGINALSILTRIIPSRLLLLEAELSYPSNCETPIAARLLLADSRRMPIRVELDFRQTGLQSWDIEIDTNDGRLWLAMGGSVMRINGQAITTPDSHEYALLYAHFATLVRARRTDVDLAPFQLVADALMCGRHLAVDPFEEF